LHFFDVRPLTFLRRFFSKTPFENWKSFLDVYFAPFGVELDNRHGAETERHAYGFQGQEGDDDIKGDGNSVNYKYRMHDPRIGRFFAVDPLAWQYSYNSPYAFSENRVVDAIELEGLEKVLIDPYISIPYKPVLNASSAYQGVENSCHNILSLMVNTIGGAANGIIADPINYIYNSASSGATGGDMVNDLISGAKSVDKAMKKHVVKEGQEFMNDPLGSIYRAMTTMENYELALTFLVARKIAIAGKSRPFGYGTVIIEDASYLPPVIIV
jgi:RHS repeat-associated protein